MGDDESKTQLAEDRTEFAADWTILANERTYAAWVRTGLAALVTGLGVLRFMEQIISGWALRIVAVALMLFAFFCFVAAGWRYVHMGRRLSQATTPQVASAVMLTATGLLAIATAVALVSVFLMGR